MKMIIAIVRPFKLDEVRDALIAIDVQGMTVSEVKGFGRQKGHLELYRGAEYTTSFVPKIRFEIVVEDERVSSVVEAIEVAGKTGKIGDGKLFVLDVEQALRIRTGETNDSAL